MRFIKCFLILLSLSIIDIYGESANKIVMMQGQIINNSVKHPWHQDYNSLKITNTDILYQQLNDKTMAFNFLQASNNQYGEIDLYDGTTTESYCSIMVTNNDGKFFLQLDPNSHTDLNCDIKQFINNNFVITVTDNN